MKIRSKLKLIIKYYIQVTQFQIHRFKYRTKNIPKSMELEKLNKLGYLKLEDHADIRKLQNFKKEFVVDFESGVEFAPVHLHASADEKEVVYEKFRKVDQNKPISELAQVTNYLKYKNPLLRWPEILQVMISKELLDIAEGYLGGAPAITGCTFNRLFANDIPPMEAQKIHSDGNSVKFLKVFAYLQDTGLDMGPTCYFEGSHNLGVKRRLSDNYRVHPDYIKGLGLTEHKPLGANIGDINLCDTTGFHFGGKPQREDRDMITLNLSIHREYFSEKHHAPPKIKSVDDDWFKAMQNIGFFRYAKIVL